MNRGRTKQRRALLYEDPVDFGICTLSRARRTCDETRAVSEVHHSPSTIATYGLFAGHGGAVAADLCARNFVPTLLSDSALQTDPEKAIRNTCQALEAFVSAKSNLDKAYYGTTLLFALIKDQRLFIANIGNSRAILSTQDGVQTLTQEHDGSNAEEVARVRHAGGFFEDGKVNNLIRVTRSIGDVELKERKHITFPTRNMTEDIVISIPDVFVRQLSSRDNCLILATAEVWEHFSNRAVVQIVQDSINRRETPHIAAKNVALAALQSGAVGPISIMVLIFPTVDMGRRKAAPSAKKRISRPSGAMRHSSNAEQQLNSLQARKKVNNTPAFVRTAQAEAERVRAVKRSDGTVSPIASPQGSVVRNTVDSMGNLVEQATQRSPICTSVLTLDVPPGKHLTTGVDDATTRCRTRQANEQVIAKKRADSAIGIERDFYLPDPKSRSVYSRQQTDFARHIPAQQQPQGDRKLKASIHEKAVAVSRMSELTASGKTGDEASVFGSYGHRDEHMKDFMDMVPSGPSKVRYREDRSTLSGRLGFFKDLGKTFTRKR